MKSSIIKMGSRKSENIEFRDLHLQVSVMLKHSLLLIPVLLVLASISWQLPAIGQQPVGIKKGPSEVAAPTRPRRPIYYRARALGSLEINVKSAASTKPQLTQINPISGVFAESYIQFEPSADRVWESVPRTDSGLQLKLGGYL
jgi:hypothetical protein